MTKTYVRVNCVRKDSELYQTNSIHSIESDEILTSHSFSSQVICFNVVQFSVGKVDVRLD